MNNSLTTPNAPRLRVGVLTDIHITPPATGDEWFVKALRRFDAEHVDAVLVAGDLTTWTRRFEFEAAAAAWRKVFPDDRRSDGAPVERLFISGNHDVDGFFYPDAKFGSREEAERDSFFFHRDEWWREFFGESYEPVRVKTVKDYAFVLVNWWSRAAETYSKNPARFPLADGVVPEENPAPAFLEAVGSSLPRDRPFFFVQHEPLPGTVCQCEPDAPLDATGRILARHPNCVAISGHMHYPLTDEHSIWQGAFTAVNASCARGFAFALPGRENGHAVGDYNRDPPFEMDKFDIHAVRQGLTMDVFADRIVFRRFDIASDLPLGEDWVVPVFADGATVPPSPAAPKYSFAARAAVSRPPQFASGSAVSVREIDDGHRRNARGNGPDPAPRQQIVVSFPSIHATQDSSRPWDYSVIAEMRIKDMSQILAEKRVYSPGFCMPEALDTAPVECAFAQEAIPKERDVRFIVRPFDCWGNAGEAIRSDWVRFQKNPPHDARHTTQS
ncbi:MAG: metallophosphoesterase [Kiritimatiellae bacterium]|nr:metallophosphoesterase [Kiritimatiellia bacterium]